jgi:hypothetical protein
MPKSRGRKGRRKRPQSARAQDWIAQRTQEILDGQRQRFREKFGRDWGPDDPVFFDPDAAVPTRMSEVKMQGDVLDAMRKAGTPPEVMYAYRKTGLIHVEGLSDRWPPDRTAEWNQAIEEYFAIEAASKDPDRPDPREWTTEIPELLVSGFTRQDLSKIHEILHAIAPIEARPPGLKVVQRIELAAVFLASACDCAYDSAAATGSPGEGPELYSKTEEIVVRRAREIYANDRA